MIHSHGSPFLGGGVVLLAMFLSSGSAAEPSGRASRSAAAATQDKLAAFECREITGRDWPRTMVTYQIQRSEVRDQRSDIPGPAVITLQDRIKGDEVRLVDAEGKEQPFQFWRVERDRNGFIMSARLSFHASLATNGTYRFELVSGKGEGGSGKGPVKVTTGGGFLTLDNGLTAIRLPAAGEHQFKKPLAFADVREHARMVTLYGTAGFIPGSKMVREGVAFGPIAGVRLADGRWVGGSYFATEPIGAVQLREDYRKEPVTETDWQLALAAAPKATSYSCELTEQGALFVEARVRFNFDNGGYYQCTVQIRPGDAAVRLDEIMDLKGNCPPDHPLYVVMSLTDAGNRDAWKPDALFEWATRPDQLEGLNEALKKQGFQPRFPSLPIPYDQDDNVVTDVVVLDPWGPRAHYFGLVNTAQLGEAKVSGVSGQMSGKEVGSEILKPKTRNREPSVPFLAIVPQHGGSWRAAHWVFPPKNPHLFQQLYSYKNGDVAMRWTIRAQPHSQDVLHTGELDPDFGLTGMRRLWCLVAGPFQYHDTLYPLRAYEGFVNLDNYKDWILAWSDDTQAVANQPTPAELLQAQMNPFWHMNLAWMGGDTRGLTWFSHYRQAQNMEWASQWEKRLADPTLTPEQRGFMRRGVAAFCSLMSEPDFNTRASMSHQGNPNMPINRFFALPHAARLIPDHPRAESWFDVSAAYVRYKAGMNIAPGGVWSELVTYYGASHPTLVNGALVCRRQRRLDDATARLVAFPVSFLVRLLAPPDPRFAMRTVPGFGHEGVLAGNYWTPAAKLLRDIDPDKAAAFVWAWDQQGRPEKAYHGDGFAEITLDQADLLPQATPEVVRGQLSSAWLPGFGAELRAQALTPNETYFALRQGYLASHSDANQGDFVLFARGVPLTTLSLFGYAVHGGYPEYKKLCDEFGWHSRVRFGDQKDSGGWPGGGPVSGIHRHSFSESVDYLRGVGDYGPVPSGQLKPDEIHQRWTRQVLFLKSKAATGPNYLVLRDSFREPVTAVRRGSPDPADPAGRRSPSLDPKWWYQRTLGKKEQVTASGTGFDYASQWGPKMNVRFLQPAQVSVESREATATGPLYGHLAAQWLKAGTPVVNKQSEQNVAVAEIMTVNAVGPVAPGEDILVAIYPYINGEAPPHYESLGDGVAKIATPESADYVFVSPTGMKFEKGDLSFAGIAGAVRVYSDEVHLVVAEGAGTVTYKGWTLQAGEPAVKIVPQAEIQKGGRIEVPAPPVSLVFGLDEQAGGIQELAPGVRVQKHLADTMVMEFNSPTPIEYEKDGIVFMGRRGGIISHARAEVRLVMLDGERIACQGYEAKECTGPYDLTFSRDKVVGVAEGPARLLMLTMPQGLTQLPTVTINGTQSAPGTHDRWAIVPLMGGRQEFTLENLPQPPVYRAWQRW